MEQKRPFILPVFPKICAPFFSIRQSDSIPEVLGGFPRHSPVKFSICSRLCHPVYGVEKPGVFFRRCSSASLVPWFSSKFILLEYAPCGSSLFVFLGPAPLPATETTGFFPRLRLLAVASLQKRPLAFCLSLLLQPFGCGSRFDRSAIESHKEPRLARPKQQKEKLK